MPVLVHTLWLKFYLLFVGGRVIGDRGLSWSPAGDLRCAVVSDVQLPSAHVSLLSRDWSGDRFLRQLKTSVFGHLCKGDSILGKGWIQHTAGKCTCEGYLLHILYGRPFRACTRCLWVT